MANRFRPNRRLATELEAQPAHRAAMVEHATVVQRAAERLARAVHAPWMPRRGADSTIEVHVDTDGVRVVNTDHAGHLEEFGSRNNPAHAPLRRAAVASGLRLKDQ